MQTIDRKIIFTLFVICCLCLSGCGSDNYGGDYTAEIEFNDADDDGAMAIDIFQHMCDGTTFGNIAEYEVIYDAFANITLSVSEFSPGITVNGYTIEYIPLYSEDGTHNLVLPPTLNSLTNDYGSNSLYIPPNSSYTFTTTCLSIDQKQEYANLIGWTEVYYPYDSDADGTNDSFIYYPSITAGTVYSNLAIARYTIRYIFRCTDDNGERRNIEARRTVYFGDYDHC